MNTIPKARSGTRDERRYHHGDLAAALLVAAEAELAEKGMERFSLRGVAKRAGVSHAAPAHHFRDTQGLLAALAGAGFERLTATMQQMASKELPGESYARLVARGVGYVEFALANPALFQLMFSARRPELQGEELNAHARAAFMTLVDSVGDLRGNPPLSSFAGRLDVAAAWSIVHGVASLLIDGRMQFLAADLEAPDRHRDVIRDLIARALR